MFLPSTRGNGKLCIPPTSTSSPELLPSRLEHIAKGRNCICSRRFVRLWHSQEPPSQHIYAQLMQD